MSVIESVEFLLISNESRVSNCYDRIKRQISWFPAVFEMSDRVVYVYDDELVNACDLLPPVKKRVKLNLQ